MFATCVMCSFFVQNYNVCSNLYKNTLLYDYEKKKVGKAPLAEESDLNVVVKMMLKKFVGDLDCCYS